MLQDLWLSGGPGSQPISCIAAHGASGPGLASSEFRIIKLSNS